MSNIFWRDEKYPFIEIRKTEDSKEEYKPHSHEDFLSIGAVDGGETVMACNGKDTFLSSGKMVFFNPDEMHSCNPVGGKSRSYWMMHLDTSWCADIQSEIFGTDVFQRLVSGSVDDAELFDDFCSVCRSLVGGEQFYDVEYELLRLVSQIFEKYCSKEPQKDVSSVVLKEIASYIEDNPYENISLECLAERFRQNRFHLLRCFRAAYGLPPHAYQMNIRIQKAKMLLRSGMTIAETAAQTGFTDQSHFHRIFKKHTAATPGEYLKGQ